MDTGEPRVWSCYACPKTFDSWEGRQAHIDKAECDYSTAPLTVVSMLEMQYQLMNMLVERGKLPTYPIDMSTKEGQKLMKLTAWALVEELGESMNLLKNRAHKLSNDTAVDMPKFLEELCGDVMAYYLELCAFAGINAITLFDEYRKKNRTCIKRVLTGY